MAEIRTNPKMSVIRRFVTPNAELESISALARMECLFLVIGTIIAIWAGHFFSRFHLQWADGILGIDRVW
jgi:hypothetical protein